MEGRLLSSYIVFILFVFEKCLNVVLGIFIDVVDFLDEEVVLIENWKKKCLFCFLLLIYVW